MYEVFENIRPVSKSLGPYSRNLRVVLRENVEHYNVYLQITK